MNIMHVTIEWRDGKWPSFKIMLATKDGAEPFLEIKDCKIIDGKSGPFVSYPARKDDKGKWWPHLYGSDAFNEYVIKLATADKPKPAKPTRPAASTDDDDSSIPF